MIVPIMAISILVLTRQIYSEETNGAHAHCREPVPLIANSRELSKRFCSTLHLLFKIPNALSTVTLTLLNSLLKVCSSGSLVPSGKGFISQGACGYALSPTRYGRMSLPPIVTTGACNILPLSAL